MTRPSRTERLAMELRQMDCEDACYGQPYTLTAEQSWARITDVLRDGYRKDARRILRLVRADPTHPMPAVEP